MQKIYQPEVITKTKQIIEILSDINFFKDHEIEKTDFAEQYFNDKLTEKFINGEINDDGVFGEEEMENFLKEIIAGSILHQLKEKGYINSYEDENTDEVFFLTEEGKEYVKNMSNNQSI
jgi:hypothetical protein